MKVILRTNVDNLGKMGDVVQVTDGYARNHLLPRGLAYEASEGQIKAVAMQRKAHLKKEEAIIMSFRDVATKMAAHEYSVSCKVGEHDKMFGSVTNADVAQVLLDKGFDVDKRKIKLQNPIHELGSYSIEVRLHPEVTTTIALSVVKES